MLLLSQTAKETEKWLKQTKKKGQQKLLEAMEIQKDRCCPCLQVVQPLYSVRARLTVPPLPHRERAQAKKEEAAREKQAREEQAAATGDLSLLDMLR